MSDEFSNVAATAWAPLRRARAVTPNDSADLPDGVCRGLTCNTGGNITVILANDVASVTFTWFPGTVLPVQARRVLAAGTTATGIIAGY
jgi:hypothetical protein